MSIPNPEDQLDIRDLVTIRQFRDLHEALLAKGSLDSAGIESFLADDNMVHMDWLISNLLGGVKLKVESANSEVAIEILDHFNSAELNVDDCEESTPSETRILPFRKPQRL
jgi:hypothetical protein